MNVTDIKSQASITNKFEQKRKRWGTVKQKII